MNGNISLNLNILRKTALAGGLVGSGIGMASLLSEEDLKYERIEKNVDLAQDKDFTEHKYTSLTIYRDKNLFQEEGSYLEKGNKAGTWCWHGFLEDHIHEEKGVEYIYYIKKSDNKKLFISPKKPQKLNEGIYKGWSLNEFTWKQENEKRYGYCFVGETDVEVEKCDNLPEGWTKREISI